MPRGLIHASVLALAAGIAAVAQAGEDPVRGYLRSHPDAAEEDLLSIAPGDDLSRVLAVLHNPEAGFGATRVRVHEIGRAGVRRLEADDVARAAEQSGGGWLVDLEQRCATPRTVHTPLTWLLLQGGRVVAFDLQTYGRGCTPETPVFEASDHAALRDVGAWLFRPAGRGRFRYGALLYDEWHDAFAAPTREAALSLLQEEADRHSADARAVLRLAVVLDASGQRERAARLLERAARLDPDWRLPLDDLRALHAMQGDRAAVARIDERLRALSHDVASPPAGMPALR